MFYFTDSLDLGNQFYSILSLIFFCIMMGRFLVYCFFSTQNKTKMFENQISLLEAQSLRAQMNPHFIFNILNGIQSILILKTDEEISKYMGHLSNLLRMTLELSKKEAISIQEEVEYLKSYIELQCLRLNNRFDYCIDLKMEESASKIFIPPLLIQPIVENAILHGIIPSKNKGVLIVTIKEEPEGIYIITEDNGVGVEASKKRNKKSKIQHKSFGSKILTERIEILNHHQSSKITFTLTEIDKKEVLSGACSILFIPFLIIHKLTPKSILKLKSYEKT